MLEWDLEQGGGDVVGFMRRDLVGDCGKRRGVRLGFEEEEEECGEEEFGGDKFVG